MRRQSGTLAGILLVVLVTISIGSVSDLMAAPSPDKVASSPLNDPPEADPEDLPLLIDHHWREDFESGTVSGWFSYPPFQDTAFDFTLLPGSYHSSNHLQGYVGSGEYFYPLDLAPPDEEGSHYLLRAYRPNSGGPQKIGVARKTTFWPAGTSGLSFDYWLRYPVDATGTLQVHLSGKDGRRYMADVETPERANWQKADLPFSGFEASDGTRLSRETGIDAVAVVLELDRGVPSEYVFLALDNVQVEGHRRAGFEISSPGAAQAEQWPVEFADRHLRPGEILNPTVRSKSRLANATLAILDPSGDPVMPEHDLTETETDLWQLEEPIGLPADALGPITLRIEGRDSEGRLARSDVRAWHLKPREGRPRVLLSEADRERIHEKIADEPRFREIHNRIVSRAERARNEPFPEEVTFADLPSDYLFNTLYDWFDEMRRSRVEQIFDNALVWYLDGDPEAKEFAIESMLRMVGWEQWMHPWFVEQGRQAYYPIGHAVMSIGMAYDLLYDELTADQRAEIRRGVMEKGVIPVWQEYFEDNRIPNHTSNWISMAAGGSLVGLMAFYDELEQDGWNPDGEPWFSGLAEKFLAHSDATMLSDGSFGEGIGYQHITYSHAQDIMAALQHQFGVEKGLTDVLHYTKGHLFWLYISLDRTLDALTMGDSNPRRGALDYWSWYAKMSDDPVMKWFYSQRPGTDWQALLWDEADAHRRGEPPEEHLPFSRYFPDKGNVVFRTGWEPEDAVLVYRTGPFFNHTHLDQGNFRFHVLGEELITEAGRASYYTDPYFWSYFVQAAGHNTVLVDNYPESQLTGDFDNEISGFRDFARITDALVTDRAGFVSAELAPVYYANLETYTRRLWFVEPGVVILDARIATVGDEHTFQVQFHPPTLDALQIDENGRQATIRGEQAELRVKVLAPDTPRLNARPYPVANRDIRMRPPMRRGGALQITHDDPGTEQTFRVVLTPQKEGSGMPETVRELSGEGYTGVELNFPDGRTDRIYFSDGEWENDEFATDARSLYLSHDRDGELRASVVEGARYFRYGDRLSVTSDRPVHSSLTTTGENDRIRLSAGNRDLDESVEIRVETSAAVSPRVLEVERGASRVNSQASEAGRTRIQAVLSGGPLEFEW